MHAAPAKTDAAPDLGRRLYVYNGGFLRRRVRTLLASAGYRVCTGVPGAGDLVGIWGNSPTAYRGLAVAKKRGASVVRIEDSFLRSLHPGRRGEAPLGLIIDDVGIHFDGSRPSRLETLLREDPLDDPDLLRRARMAIDRLQHAGFTKYGATDLDAPLPPRGCILVIDQTAGDASVAASGANRQSFLDMLQTAKREHPGSLIAVKTHPETAHGLRSGHYAPGDLPAGAVFLSGALNPWALLERAAAVYTLSSQFGFDAILSGHRPVVFGQPFYAGWGLSDDRNPPARRGRQLSAEQLFAGAMIKSCVWFDPYRQCGGELEEALDALEASVRAWREDRRGWQARNIRLWKRAQFQRFFGRHKPVRFREKGAPGRRIMTWGAQARTGTRVEDGFIRSHGLGAALVPAFSLVLDDRGIYFDPSRESKLERLLLQGGLSAMQRLRARKLMERLCVMGASKYNLGGEIPPLPAGHKLLVIGQVEDDASLRLGGNGHDNATLLRQARAQNPDALLIWKPHPDVEAGLRPGGIDAGGLADVTLSGAGSADSLAIANEVWTISSLMGFEALIRQIPVTCLGAPFYAGWGLTRDLGPVPSQRAPGVDLETLVHRSLIDYPRYIDPVTGLPCQVELVLNRLELGATGRRPRFLGLVSKLQGIAASRAHLWR